MKKIYSKPNITVVSVSLQRMIAASSEVQMGGDYSGGAVGARQAGSFWDEDEE